MGYQLAGKCTLTALVAEGMGREQKEGMEGKNEVSKTIMKDFY